MSGPTVDYNILFSSPNEGSGRPDLISSEGGEVDRSSSSFDGGDDPPPPQTKVYATRYWVLGVFSLVLFFQCMVWNTWGPITESALAVFPDWSDKTIAALSNWGPIGFVVLVLPISWGISRWGLRPITVLLTGSCVLGHGCRSLTIQPFIFNKYPVLFTVSAHICGALNGVLATIVLSASLIPAMWFPATQRVTATAFSTVVNQMGAGGSFLEPLLVRSPNSTASKEEIKRDISDLMLIELGIASALFAAVVIYFPSAPPLPPTASSMVPRYNFKQGFVAVAKNPTFWLLVIPYGIFTGVSSAWISVITFSLEKFGFDQNEVGWLGLYVAICIGVVSLLTAFLADKFYGRLKMALLVLMLVSSLSYLWFMLMSIDVIPSSKAQVYVSVLAGQAFNFAATPFFFELCCETVYPAPESVTGTVACLLNNLVAFIFLGLFYIPSIVQSGSAWMTYVLLGSNFGMMVPVVFSKENYQRSRLDREGLN